MDFESVVWLLRRALLLESVIYVVAGSSLTLRVRQALLDEAVQLLDGSSVSESMLTRGLAIFWRTVPLCAPCFGFWAGACFGLADVGSCLIYGVSDSWSQTLSVAVSMPALGLLLGRVSLLLPGYHSVSHEVFGAADDADS